MRQIKANDDEENKHKTEPLEYRMQTQKKNY